MMNIFDDIDLGGYFFLKRVLCTVQSSHLSSRCRFVTFRFPRTEVRRPTADVGGPRRAPRVRNARFGGGSTEIGREGARQRREGGRDWGRCSKHNPMLPQIARQSTREATGGLTRATGGRGVGGAWRRRRGEHAIATAQ